MLPPALLLIVLSVGGLAVVFLGVPFFQCEAATEATALILGRSSMRCIFFDGPSGRRHGVGFTDSWFVARCSGSEEVLVMIRAMSRATGFFPSRSCSSTLSSTGQERRHYPTAWSSQGVATFGGGTFYQLALLAGVVFSRRLPTRSRSL